jgi:GT2 family glycosyltransferase
VSDVLLLCTLNRPVEVRTCLESVRAQTHVPDRVVVVDASADNATRAVVEELASAWPTGSLAYHHAERGIIRQRLTGVEITAEDIVHFVDDDTLLEPGYFAAILDAFAQDTEGSVGGVGGFVTNQPPHRYRPVDTWLGLDSPREGAVLPSGRNIRIYTELDSTVDVDWLTGCSMSFRRDVFATERFDVTAPRTGEDVQFSYRVRQHRRLVVTPRARIAHYESQRERMARELLVRAELVSRYARVRAGTGRLGLRAFWVSALGQFVWYGAKGLLTLSRERLVIAKQTAAGIIAIARDRRT